MVTTDVILTRWLKPNAKLTRENKIKIKVSCILPFKKHKFRVHCQTCSTINITEVNVTGTHASVRPSKNY